MTEKKNFMTEKKNFHKRKNILFTRECVSWKFVIIKMMHSDVLDLHINLCQLTFPQQVTAIY